MSIAAQHRDDEPSRKECFNQAVDDFVKVMGCHYNEDPKQTPIYKLLDAFYTQGYRQRKEYEKYRHALDNSMNLHTPHGFAEAVVMYQTRKDKHRDETALLFDPACQHVKALRYVIYTVKSEYPADSEPYHCATIVENALNNVQQNPYIPASVQKPHTPLKIMEYIGDVAVVREFGEWDGQPGKGGSEYKGDVIYEMPTRCVLPALRESNILEPYTYNDDMRLDFVAIDSNGSSRQFHCPFGQGGDEILQKKLTDEILSEISRARLPSDETKWLISIRHWRPDDPKLEEPKNKALINEFIDRITDAFPSRVTEQAQQRRFA